MSKILFNISHDEKINNEIEYHGMKRPLLRTTFVIGLVVFIFAVLIMLFGCSLARAAASDCEFIKNADDRHLCRAQAKDSQSECYFIKDHDKRHMCMAKFPRR